MGLLYSLRASGNLGGMSIAIDCQVSLRTSQVWNRRKRRSQPHPPHTGVLCTEKMARLRSVY